MARWYQNAIIDGVAMPVRRRDDTTQLRWSEILAPLIPADGEGRLFVELGCNAGFYPRMARGMGYRAIGVERNPVFYRQARYWERRERVGVELIHDDLMHYKTPANYLTLMACVHYWLESEQFDALLKRLRNTSLHLVIMGKHSGRSTIPPDRRNLLARMKGWQIEEQTRNRRHYGVLFRNPRLFEADTEELYTRHVEATAQVGGHSDFFPAFIEFVQLVNSGQEYDYRRTAFHTYLRRRNLRYRETLMEAYAGHVLSIRADGIRRPIVVRDGMVVDGNHRLVIAHVLGIPKVICRYST